MDDKQKEYELLELEFLSKFVAFLKNHPDLAKRYLNFSDVIPPNKRYVDCLTVDDYEGGKLPEPKEDSGEIK